MIKTKLNIEALPDEFVESLATKDDINDINSALTDVDTALSDKQDVLVSGTNIKTVNGTTLLGKGNINIPIYDDTEIVQSIQEIQEHISENELTIAKSLTDLDTNKASKSDVAQMIGTSTETLETLQNITEYIVNNGQEAANLVENVQINAENIDETKKMAVDSKTLDISYAENDIDIHYNAIDGGEYSLKIEVATEESAGVMSAEDKKEQVKKTPLVNGDIIVGQTREIHSRNGKTVSDSFLARTTAGSGTIGDGVASLKSVGGNIVKNLVGNVNDNGWKVAINSCAISTHNGIMTINPTTETFQQVVWGITLDSAFRITGHQYYYHCDIKSANANDYIGFGVMNYRGADRRNVAKAASTSEWQALSVIVNTAPSSSYLGCTVCDKRAILTTLYAKNFLVIDLTEMFGAGNEPTKEECDKMFGTMDALPQGLSIAKPTEFKSTGFNQFNPDNVLNDKAIVDNAIESGDKKIAVIPCLPCKVGVGENNGYCIHGDFGDDIKVYLTPLNPMEVEGELYMHELTKDATTDTYVPLIKGYMLVEVPTTANLCAHFLWSEDKCDRNAYEPYYESKVELPVIPQMSEWGLAGIQQTGTLACDEIDFERGVYIKRINKVVFNGTEHWMGGNNSSLYCRGIKPLVKPNSKHIINWNGFINYYTGDNTYLLNNETSTSVFYIRPTSLNITTMDAWKEYLAQNNLELYYELEIPEEYPLPKVDNNYISSDYGVEQFDSVVPCNANNLYYMRSLAGETRNFLDRLYNNTDKADAKEVADYVTNGIESNKELATNAPNLALRALFVAAGAEYNDTGNLIIKDTPWKDNIDSAEYKAQWNLDVLSGTVDIITYGGKTYEFLVDTDGTWKIITRVGDKMIWEDTKVIHRPGYYYLNGLGDITEEQMLSIYNIGRTVSPYSDVLFSSALKNFVTNIPAKLNGGEGTYVRFYYICSGNSNIKVFRNTTNSKTWSNTIHCAWDGCSKLRHVVPTVDVNGATAIAHITNAFKNCFSLVNCHLRRLKFSTSFENSPLISKYSILNTIKDAIPTTAITITLHADAYARLKDDADIVTALDTKNAALAAEGKGGSINLISV